MDETAEYAGKNERREMEVSAEDGARATGASVAPRAALDLV
jgi:hypothetical protein